MLVVALLVPVAWLLGTFPSALLVARAHGRDVLKEGSGNPGASNVARLLGWRAGAVVLLSTSRRARSPRAAGCRSAAAPARARSASPRSSGHTFPLYRKGGKGVAAAGGALVVLYPLIVVGLAVVWFVVARLLHKASLASLLATVLFPVAVAAMRYDAWEIGVVVGARRVGDRAAPR